MHGREPSAEASGRKIVCILGEPVTRVIDNDTNAFFGDDFMVSTAYYDKNMSISDVATDTAVDDGSSNYMFPKSSSRPLEHAP